MTYPLKYFRWLKKLPLIGRYVTLCHLWLLRQPPFHTALRFHYYAFRAWLGIGCGIQRTPRTQPLIVSMTTIRERIETIHVPLTTLLLQSTRPDLILLWVPDTLSMADLPLNLRRLCKKGVEIRFCRDIGPHTKLLYTLKAYPNAVIITADDDFFYPSWLVGKLYAAYQSEPNLIHCHVAREMLLAEKDRFAPYLEWPVVSSMLQGPSYFLLPLGCCGVLYPPGALHEDVFDEKMFTKLSPASDDLWFKAMSLRKKTLCKKLSLHGDYFPELHLPNAPRLKDQNIYMGGNDIQAEALFANYKLYEQLQSFGGK